MKSKRIAIVLSGGGSRGAYEAGVIRYIRTALKESLGEHLDIRYFVGSSVGAINAAYLSALAHDPGQQGDGLVALWENLRSEDIYRRGPIPLGKFFFRSLVGISSHLLGVKGGVDPDDQTLTFNSIFDTQPFFHFLMKNCPWHLISKNIEQGFLDALAISATNVHSGHIELFVEKSDHCHFHTHLQTHEVKISPRHVMASAALPVLFPAVPIQGIYYNDGGLRMKTPLTPAVGFAADKVLIIGTRGKQSTVATPLPVQPGLGSILGKMFGAVFQDRLDTDRAQLDRINRILKHCQSKLSPQAFMELCEASNTYPIETLYITPSEDIALFVDDTLRNSYKRLKNMGILEKSILRLLEIDVQKGSDLLSYFLFEPSYLKRLIHLGYQDASRLHESLVHFAQSKPW